MIQIEESKLISYGSRIMESGTFLFDDVKIVYSVTFYSEFSPGKDADEYYYAALSITVYKNDLKTSDKDAKKLLFFRQRIPLFADSKNNSVFGDGNLEYYKIFGKLTAKILRRCDEFILGSNVYTAALLDICDDVCNNFIKKFPGLQKFEII